MSSVESRTVPHPSPHNEMSQGHFSFPVEHMAVHVADLESQRLVFKKLIIILTNTTKVCGSRFNALPGHRERTRRPRGWRPCDGSYTGSSELAVRAAWPALSPGPRCWGGRAGPARPSILIVCCPEGKSWRLDFLLRP